MRRAGAEILGLGALAAAPLLVYCGGPPTERSNNVEPPPLRVEYSGCESVLRGPVCVLPQDRRLRLWIETTAGARLEIDGRPPPEGVEVAGGRRYEVEVAESASELVVEARRGRDGTAWRLGITHHEESPGLRRARLLARGGRLDAARGLVEADLADPEFSDRGPALSLLARIDDAQGKRLEAEIGFVQAVRAWRQSGRISAAVDDATVLAFRRIQRRDFAGARAVLEGLPQPPAHADSAYLRSYYLGLLGSESGDLRTGLRHLSEAAEQAERLGLTRMRLAALQVLAREKRRIGDLEAHADLRQLLDDAEADPLPDCDLAQLLNNYAWASILALEAGLPADDPLPHLRRAIALIDECPLLSEERVNLRVNLALAHLLGNRPELARRELGEASRLGPDPDTNTRLWWADLEARIALAEGAHEEALEHSERLASLARQALSPEAEWRAAVGRARVLDLLGETGASLAAHRDAEAFLDRELLLIPMDSGRDAFLAQRQRATGDRLDSLLRNSREREALDVLRRARSRSLRHLRRFVEVASLKAEDRRAWDEAMAAYLVEREELDRAAAEAWRLPSDRSERELALRQQRFEELRRELDALLVRLDGGLARRDPPPPREGELLLAFYPLAHEWIGLAATADRVTARRLGALAAPFPRPDDLAAQLLRPFAEPIRSARRLRVLAHGPLREIDFHALPFDGDVLLARLPIAYGFDLPAAPPASAGDRALVVTDPEGNLEHAAAEADAIVAGLGASWSLDRLNGTDATGGALRRRLSGVRLFHYAGHAVFAGWDSFLRLNGDHRLTVDDVLALARAPDWVVLSGCETGRGFRGGETMGLAHAFAAAGASRIVAASRPLPDADAAAFVGPFYSQLGDGAEPVEALRAAQLELRRSRPEGAWRVFRVYVP